MTHRTSPRRSVLVVAAYAVVLGVGAGCSTASTQPAVADPTVSAAPQPTHPGLPRRPTSTPTPGNRRLGVVCLPVAAAVADDIAAGASAGLHVVPGRTVGYRARGLGGDYLVAMQFTLGDDPRTLLGVWVVEDSIRPGDHGPISAVDGVAQRVTWWPDATQVAGDAVVVSESRACQMF